MRQNSSSSLPTTRENSKRQERWQTAKQTKTNKTIEINAEAAKAAIQKLRRPSPVQHKQNSEVNKAFPRSVNNAYAGLQQEAVTLFLAQNDIRLHHHNYRDEQFESISAAPELKEILPAAHHGNCRAEQ